VVSRGLAHDASRLPALVAVDGEQIVGLATFRMRLVGVHPRAVDEARRIKPSIPEFGEHGIAIHDELEFALCA
jgi:hypothetical protein